MVQVVIISDEKKIWREKKNHWGKYSMRGKAVINVIAILIALKKYGPLSTMNLCNLLGVSKPVIEKHGHRLCYLEYITKDTSRKYTIIDKGLKSLKYDIDSL